MEVWQKSYVCKIKNLTRNQNYNMVATKEKTGFIKIIQKRRRKM